MAGLKDSTFRKRYMMKYMILERVSQQLCFEREQEKKLVGAAKRRCTEADVKGDTRTHRAVVGVRWNRA